jgi:hypothetical protein
MTSSILHTIALFGEAEKGDYRSAYFCRSLAELEETFGNPPKDSHGLYYAIQAILFHRMLIFFRVREEGYSIQDYLLGLHFLENRQMIPRLSAICLPGVGNSEVIHAGSDICCVHKSMLIVTESDLYDFLTSEP